MGSVGSRMCQFAAPGRAPPMSDEALHAMQQVQVNDAQALYGRGEVDDGKADGKADDGKADGEAMPPVVMYVSKRSHIGSWHWEKPADIHDAQVSWERCPGCMANFVIIWELPGTSPQAFHTGDQYRTIAIRM